MKRQLLPVAIAAAILTSVLSMAPAGAAAGDKGLAVSVISSQCLVDGMAWKSASGGWTEVTAAPRDYGGVGNGCYGVGVRAYWKNPGDPTEYTKVVYDTQGFLSAGFTLTGAAGKNASGIRAYAKGSSSGAYTSKATYSWFAI